MKSLYTYSKKMMKIILSTNYTWIILVLSVMNIPPMIASPTTIFLEQARLWGTEITHCNC